MSRAEGSGTREGARVIAKISGESVVVTSGVVAASASGNILIAKISGESVVMTSGVITASASGNIIIAKISGESVVVTSGVVAASASGNIVIAKVSGESVVVTSGLVVAKVSGEVVDIKVPTSVTSGGIFVVGAQSGGLILTSGACISATIKAMVANSGDIYVSGNPMQSGQGFVLSAGEAVNLDVDNFGRVKLLAQISGDRVTYVGVL